MFTFIAVIFVSAIGSIFGFNKMTKEKEDNEQKKVVKKEKIHKDIKTPTVIAGSVATIGAAAGSYYLYKRRKDSQETSPFSRFKDLENKSSKKIKEITTRKKPKFSFFKKKSIWDKFKR